MDVVDDVYMCPMGPIEHGQTYYPDEYARFLVYTNNYATATRAPKSGNIWIYKVNTKDITDFTKVKTCVSGVLNSRDKLGFGEHRDGLNIFSWGIPSGNAFYQTVAGYAYEGDPRCIHYWNENTNASGSYLFDDSQGMMWGSHCGGAVRFDSDGNIWGCGSGYFGATEGDDAYKGQIIHPSICSGNSSPSGTYTQLVESIDNSTGGCGGAFEIMES